MSMEISQIKDMGIKFTRYIFMVLALLSLKCMTTIDVLRPFAEMGKIKTDLTPLPESLLTIREFTANDTLPILYFERLPGYELKPVYKSYKLYNDGRLEYLEYYDVIRSVQVGLTDVQRLIFYLNQLGYFKVSNKSIYNRMFAPRKICCLGVFFIDSGYYSFLDQEEFTVEFNLKQFKHRIRYYGLGEDTERFKNIEDLEILAKSITIISDFLEREIQK